MDAIQKAKRRNKEQGPQLETRCGQRGALANGFADPLMTLLRPLLGIAPLPPALGCSLAHKSSPTTPRVEGAGEVKIGYDAQGKRETGQAS